MVAVTKLAVREEVVQAGAASEVVAMAEATQEVAAMATAMGAAALVAAKEVVLVVGQMVAAKTQGGMPNSLSMNC